MIRHIAEKLSRGRILRRKLPASLGGTSLLVSPEMGGLKYWKWNLEKSDPELLAITRKLVKPGMSVWDVGANVGLFTFPSAFLAGTAGYVLAIDADVDNASLLLKSRSRLDTTRNAVVDILPVAIAGAGQQVVRFSISSRARAANALEGFGNVPMGAVRETRHVPAMSLDELMNHFRKPELLKIDVEGAELLVLQSATKLLTEVRPGVFVEVEQRNSDSVGAFFKSLDYRLADALSDASDTQDLPAAPWNCLAVPKIR